MSTLFETYYDSLGHEVMIGTPIAGKTSKGFIFGHIVNFHKNKKNENIYEIVPDIGHPKNVEKKKSYKIRDINTFLITVKKK